MTADEAVLAELFAEPGEQPGGRPVVVANMVQSLNGAIAIDGRSGALGNQVDTGVLMGMRARCDLVLVGSSTVEAEGYGRALPDEARRRARVEQGLSEEPAIGVVSRELGLDRGVRLLADPAARVLMITASGEDLGTTAAQVGYVRLDAEGFALADALDALHREHGVRTITCEGGPGLNAALAAEGLLDEMVVAIAPTVVDREGDPGVIAAGALAEPRDLRLLAHARHEDYLWLRYALRR